MLGWSSRSPPRRAWRLREGRRGLRGGASDACGTSLSGRTNKPLHRRLCEQNEVYRGSVPSEVFSGDIALDVRTGDGESGQICANVSRALRNDLTAGRLAFAETSEDLLAEAVSLGAVAHL